MKKKKIFIIARRFKDVQQIGLGGFGIEGKDYSEHIICDSFIEFWVNLFFDNDKIKQKLPQETPPLLISYLTEGDTESKKKKLRDIFSQIVDIDCINEINHLVNIYALRTESESTNIFVYRHWLNNSLQGFKQEKKKDFLSNLRKNVLEILSKDGKNNNTSFSFNWMIHDKDIFIKPKDETLLYDKSLLYLDGKSYVAKKVKEEIHEDLHEDNIWLFTHDNGDAYFRNIILNSDNKSWTADSLYNYLVIDKENCERRIKENGWKDTDILTERMITIILKKEIPYPEFSIKALTGKNIRQLKDILIW